MHKDPNNINVSSSHKYIYIVQPWNSTRVLIGSFTSMFPANWILILITGYIYNQYVFNTCHVCTICMSSSYPTTSPEPPAYICCYILIYMNKVQKNRKSIYLKYKSIVTYIIHAFIVHFKLMHGWCIKVYIYFGGKKQLTDHKLLNSSAYVCVCVCVCHNPKFKLHLSQHKKKKIDFTSTMWLKSILIDRSTGYFMF